MSVIWNLLGTERVGTQQNSRFGQKIALSANGTVLAVGAPFETNTVVADGVIRLYEHNGSDWTPIGTIIGQAAGERIGSAIALSGDGSRLAIGIPNEEKVRVYDRNGSSWNLVGSELEGASQIISSEFGESVSLSSDGSVLVVGSPSEGADPQSPSGAVRIFDYDVGGSWLEPEVISGSEGGSRYGATVAISGNKNFIAVGAPHASSGGTERGNVHVLTFNSSLGWTSLTHINGEGDNDRSGSSIGISNDGSRIVIGTTLFNGTEGLDTGYIRITELTVEAYPVMSGGHIEGTIAEQHFGAAVAISGDGNTVVASSTTTGAGFIRTFEWESAMAMWFETSSELLGDTPDSEFGKSIALSNTGTRMAVGIPFGGDILGTSDLGAARVYNRPGDSVTTTTMFPTIPPTTTVAPPTTTVSPPTTTTITPPTTTIVTTTMPPTTAAPETTQPTTQVPGTTLYGGLTEAEIIEILKYWIPIIHDIFS